MREGGFEDTPGFYDSVTDRPYTDRLHTGGHINFTVLTIVETIRDTRILEKGQLPQFPHKQKRRCEPLVRFRYQGTEEWITIPTTVNLGGTFGSEEWVYISDITEEYVEIDWFIGGFGAPKTVEFEINLLGFSI